MKLPFLWTRLASLLLAASLGCTSTTSGDDPEVGKNGPDGDGDIAQPLTGQSGNEGTSLRYPCFSQAQAVVIAEVTSHEGGCFEGTVSSLVTEGAADEGLAEGDVLGGVASLFYTSEAPAAGDVVVVQYYSEQGESGPSLGGSVQITPMQEGDVVVEWLGGEYEFSLEQLLSSECEALFADLPNLLPDEEESGVDPDDGKPPEESPLTCPTAN